MGRKAPERVLILSYLPQVDALRVQIIYIPKFAILNHGFQFLYSRMVFHQVSHHQPGPILLHQMYQFTRMSNIECKGFFDENVLALAIS